MSLPDVSNAILNLGDPLTIAVIAKSTAELQAQEIITRFKTVYGVATPTQPQELQLLPEGEREWRYLTFFSTDTTLKNDYYVEDEAKTQFRIVSVEPWRSFTKYTLQECPTAGSAELPAENFASEGPP